MVAAPWFGSLIFYTSGFKIGGMDPNGYGASSTYTVVMIWKNVGIMVKGEKLTKSVFGETFTMYL